MESNVEFELSQPLRVLDKSQLNQAMDVTPPPQRTLLSGARWNWRCYESGRRSGAAGAGAGRPPQ